MLQPLGHRVLIKPDVQPEASASGLILPENRDHVPVSGQVVALGPGGSQLRFKTRERTLGDAIALALHHAHHGADEHKAGARAVAEAIATTRLQMFPMPERDIKVGDFVVFPAESGFHVTHEGEAYILVNEDDLAVLETA